MEQTGDDPTGLGKVGRTLHLLDREPTEEYRREWTERIAARKTVTAQATASAVIFQIGQELLALPTPIFREIAKDCPGHTIPHRRSEMIAGIVNVRGDLLVCVSLGVVLGIQAATERINASQQLHFETLMVASKNGNPVAFPVDEVLAIVRYDPSGMRRPPATIAGSSLPFTTGLLPWAERTVGFLDDERLFHHLDLSFG